jgi:predicted secreted hydrolase
MSKRLVWVGLLGFVLLASVFYFLRPQETPDVKASLLSLPAASGDFARVTGPMDLQFPRDHGAHPDMQTEWWYTTGNLNGPNGERYGFQLTFFRRALLGADLRETRGSAWGADQVFLAHFTLTDGQTQQFYAYERLERGAVGLAGAMGEDGMHVWLHDWSVEQTGTDRYLLTAAEDGVRLDLEMRDRKCPVLQGDRGYSRKGPEAGNASTYISQTRLETVGTLEIEGRQIQVEGLSWMDHEFSTSALSQGQIGWDWFSIQLDDGSELMLYTIRRADGSIDPFSQGTVIAADGTTRRLAAGDFQIAAEDTWRSKKSGGTYPSAWTVTVPGEGLVLQIKPVLADQELNLSFVYWEGAVDIQGTAAGKLIRGRGYVELTGYSQSLEGRF